jgi:hypothetical protein
MQKTLKRTIAVAIATALAASAGTALLACFDSAGNCLDTSSCPPPDAGDAADEAHDDGGA